MSTPFEQAGFTADDVFTIRSGKSHFHFKHGDQFKLKEDDGSFCPFFHQKHGSPFVDGVAVYLRDIERVEQKPEGKTLLQIMAEELPKRGGWPQFQRELQAVQDADGEIKFHLTDYPLSFQRNKPGNWGSDCESAWLLCQVRDSGDYKSNPNIDCETLASDYATAIITREQYEAALAEQGIHKIKFDCRIVGTDGWIDWPGGKPPVDNAAVVDLKFRGGEIASGLEAGKYYWPHTGYEHDIIAYRLHQPQEAVQAKADDEADLNDCIGQAPAPVYSGYGVPPVGAAIEWREGRRWYPGTVTAIGEQLIIIKDQHGEEGSYSLEHTDFRRANFEVDELAAVIDASDEGGELIPSHQKAIAKHLIDAGYRKQ